jgi:hypothetical protein
MTPWLRLTLTLIGLALVGLFLRLSQPAFLNHAVVVSKPGLASWREPTPGPPTASIYLSMKFDPVRARPLPSPVRDYVWTKCDLGPPGLPTQKPPEPIGPWRVFDQSWQLKARPPAAILHEIPAPPHRI